MILVSKYDETEKIDEVFYESSNIYYSKAIEHKNDNFVDLYVTFKNGATYLYKDVDMVKDYVMFKHGGLDGSQGKALNKFIKPKYEFEKVENANMELLKEEYIRLKYPEERIEGEGEANNTSKMEEFEEYKVGENEYDLTKESDFSKVYEMFKTITSDDVIIVNKQ